MANDKWPAYFWGPNGGFDQFRREVDVPEGWADAPFPGVDYSGNEPGLGQTETMAAMNADLVKALEAGVEKDARIAELEQDLQVEKARSDEYRVAAQNANTRADDAERAAAAEVEALKAAHAEEVASLRDGIADLKAQIAKFDKDGDGKVGGSAPKSPKQ